MAVTPENAAQEVTEFFVQQKPLQAVFILVIAIVIAYLASKYLAQAIIKIAQRVATHSDTISDQDKVIKLRQVETYLSVTVAIVRALVVAVVAYFTWRALAPAPGSGSGANGAAAIGASAFFIVIAGQTLGTILRDITSGSIMIIEQWFNVGDFIKVEPFIDVSGVVERFTLRSTKLRSLNGDVIWIHNQQIQAAHVTPRGVRSFAVDVFVRDRTAGERALEELIVALPAGPTMLASPLRIKNVERWSDDLWRITILGKTAPGREWLIEKFFVNAIIEVDRGKVNKDDRIFVYEPIARYADPVTDQKFKRAIRTDKDEV